MDKINLKFSLKSIGLYNNKEEENTINILVQSSEQEKEEDDYLNKNEDNGSEKESIHIIVKFSDEKIKVEVSENINGKILSNNNEERLAFDGYFNEINNTIKDIEEDF